MKPFPTPKPGEVPWGLVNDAVVADVTGCDVERAKQEREARGLPPFRRGKTDWSRILTTWGQEAALAWLGTSCYAAALRAHLAGPTGLRNGRAPNTNAPPNPKLDGHPWGLLADGIIADIAGLSRFTARVERERRDIAPGPKGNSSWDRLIAAWGLERATAYVAGTRYAAKLRAHLGGREKPEARRAVTSRLRALPVELRESVRGCEHYHGTTIDPERVAEKRRAASPVPAGHSETVEEYLRRGGEVKRVPSGVVTARTLRILQALKAGFPHAPRGMP